VPTARNVGRSSGRVRRRAWGLPYPASGQRSCPSVLHVCLLTGAPRRRRPDCCPPFHAPIPPATLTDCPVTSDGGGGDSPAHRPGVDGHCASLVALPPYPPRRRRWGPGMAPGLAPSRPAVDPTPITQVKVRTRAKLGVSIETRELRLSSRECDFP